jgi:predicted O-linked N-acetylglucosamine transferase (SPINDLY family)
MSRRATKRAPQARPAQAARLFAEAVNDHQSGHLDRAERTYRQICATKPDHAESWSNLALVLLTRGKADEAVAACRKAIALRHDYVEAHQNLASALEAARAFTEAAEAYRRLLILLPTRGDLWRSFATLLAVDGRLDQSVLAFREALAIQPDDDQALFGMARSLATLGWRDAAIALYRRLLALTPYNAAAASNLGTLLAAAGQFAEAVAVSTQAAALLPDNAEIHCNLGVVLQRAGHAAPAVEAYRRAIALRPDYAAAYGNLAAGLQELFKFDEAADALKQALRVDPGFETAALELIKIRRHICDWSEYEADHTRLLAYIDAENDLIFGLILMAFPSNAGQQLACARKAMRQLNASPARVGPHLPRGAAHRLRIGYLSTDYRDHPVGRLLPEMLRLHDRRKVEVIGYSLGTDDPGQLRARIKQACDSFVDLHQLSSEDAARRIHADGIDILVDLTGPTVGSRLEIVALRPAPVQVSFLGWPGSVGADCLDYVVADPFLVPQDQQPFYVEKIVQLPECYQPSDPHRRFADPPPTRASCGLPETGFVFCSFNNTVKITPDLFDLWMRLLDRVEGSVLWLYCKSETTIRNLRQRAAMHRVPADRIIFAAVAPMDVYLSRLRLADLFLDTHPYTAGATCNDALWAGLPVLTCAGDTYVSRMAGSMLHTANLPELITTSFADYEERAVQLATTPARLAEVKRRLVRARQDSPLFDMARFARHLEAAYQRMHELHTSGRPPAPFAVPALPRDGLFDPESMSRKS